MSAKARVLIVDPSTESRDILRILLERQGAETYEANGTVGATEAIAQLRPDVIVLDEDCAESPPSEAADELGRAATRSAIPIVVLGTARRHLSPLPTGEVVAKPYHYAALIRRIEEILGDRQAGG